MARKITISFKNTTKDKELYDLVMEMEDKSVEIKNILREALLQKEVVIKNVENKKSVNILDF